MQGKLRGRPFAVVRGRADLVLPPGEDGPGARALIRPEGADLFGYGAREAVLRALRGDPADRAPFGAPVPAAELAAIVGDELGLDAAPVPGGLEVSLPPGGATATLAVLAFAHGWEVGPLFDTAVDPGTRATDEPILVGLRPMTP